MFAYSDPTGTSILQTQATGGIDALSVYRSLIDRLYQGVASETGNAFTWLEAFDEVAAATRAVVEWRAFPLRFAAKAPDEVDADRANLQEEYVEWRVERTGQAIRSITFTTEFVEYYMALAFVGMAAVVEGIRKVMSSATSSHFNGPMADSQPSDYSPRTFRIRSASPDSPLSRAIC